MYGTNIRDTASSKLWSWIFFCLLSLSIIIKKACIHRQIMIVIKKAARLKYDEKKTNMSNLVTPTAQISLNTLAHGMGISRSEFLEQIGRGLLQVSAPTQ